MTTMKTIMLPAGSLDTNCYIVYDEAAKVAVVIDPSDEASLAAARVESLGLEVRGILLTHGHYDHAADAARIAARSGAEIWLHPADRSLPSWLTHGLPETRDLADGETLDFDGLRFTVLHTPGHTPGGVCFRCEDRLFVGDTLFAASCGRTDLPGGSWKELIASLRRLAELPGDYTVCPGHGDQTTLERERENNPYLRMAVRDAKR